MNDDKKRKLFFEKSTAPSASDLKTLWTSPPSDYVIGGLNVSKYHADLLVEEDREGTVLVRKLMIEEQLKALDRETVTAWNDEQRNRFMRYVTTRLEAAQTSKPPTLNRLSSWSDALPLDLRRQVKAMAGDYQPEIARLHAEGRYGFAWWNAKLAWITAIWMVVKWPLAAARDLFKAFTVR